MKTAKETKAGQFKASVLAAIQILDKAKDEAFDLDWRYDVDQLDRVLDLLAKITSTLPEGV